MYAATRQIQRFHGFAQIHTNFRHHRIQIHPTVRTDGQIDGLMETNFIVSSGETGR